MQLGSSTEVLRCVSGGDQEPFHGSPCPMEVVFTFIPQLQESGVVFSPLLNISTSCPCTWHPDVAASPRLCLRLLNQHLFSD